MTHVTLTDLWVHRADDPDQFVTFDGGTAAAGQTVAGAVLTMANGRSRAISAAGSARDIQVTLPHVDRDDYLTLADWVDAGYELMLRDVFGRVVWGRIFDLPAGDPDLDTVNLSFAFKIVSHSEVV